MLTLVFVSALAAAPESASVSISGSIEASLVRTLPDAGRALAAQVARLLRWRGDVVRNIQPNDQLTVVYRSGARPQLLAMDYDGLQIELRAYRFRGDDDVARFYDETGQLVEPWMRKLPTPEYQQITETVQFGRGKRQHHGLDLKAAAGAPIILPYAGRVSRVNWRTRWNGRCVEIIYDDGHVARFLHLGEVADAVAPGQKLPAGTPIGTVGNTGRSSAPHLHYEVRGKNGQKTLDPLEYHGTQIRSLGPGPRQAFSAVRDDYDALLARARGDHPT